MSVLLKTDLKEYARQCTLQRRRYEECVQEAHRSGMTQATAATACSIDQIDGETLLSETSAFSESTEQVTQGSLVDLLGMSAEPFAWDDSQVTRHDANNGVTEAHQWRGDRTQLTQPHSSSVPKNVSSVSYGAP